MRAEPERYRSGHNGADSKSDGRVKPARGFESHPLRHAVTCRFERAARRGKARSADKAQYWDLFTTFYRNLIEMPAEHLPHTFVEAFAAAYREALKKPAA